MCTEAAFVTAQMSLILRKPVYGVSEQVRHNQAVQLQKMVRVLEFRKKRDRTYRVAKTKALISFAVTTKLICAFIFAYIKWYANFMLMAHLQAAKSCISLIDVQFSCLQLMSSLVFITWIVQSAYKSYSWGYQGVYRGCLCHCLSELTAY